MSYKINPLNKNNSSIKKLLLDAQGIRNSWLLKPKSSQVCNSSMTFNSIEIEEKYLSCILVLHLKRSKQFVGLNLCYGNGCQVRFDISNFFFFFALFASGYFAFEIYFLDLNFAVIKLLTLKNK